MVRSSADDIPLIEALESFGLSGKSVERCEVVLSTLMKRVSASSGVVYFLDSQAESLVPAVVLGSKGLASPLAVERIVVPKGGVGPAAALVAAGAGGRSRRDKPGGMAIYVTRADSCVAVVRLEGGRLELVNGTGLRALRALASLLLVVHNQRTELAPLVADSTALLELEVGRSVRHAAMNHLDLCQAYLREIYVAVRGTDLESAVHLASESLVEVNESLNQLRAPRLELGDEFRSVALRLLWDEAAEILAESIATHRIAARYVGEDVGIDVRRDWFVNVLLNLLSNSIDTFRAQAKYRRERWIELSVCDPSGPEKDISLIYRDNAGGINPAMLKAPPESAGLPIQQLIFERGVTSKQGKGGFGLFLARSILDFHGGSIDLLDYCGGVSFEISLPSERVGSVEHVG